MTFKGAVLSVSRSPVVGPPSFDPTSSVSVIEPQLFPIVSVAYLAAAVILTAAFALYRIVTKEGNPVAFLHYYYDDKGVSASERDEMGFNEMKKCVQRKQ